MGTEIAVNISMTIPEVVTRTETLLEIWSQEHALPEVWRERSQVAKSAIESGEVASLCAALKTPNDQSETARMIAELMASFIPPKDFNMRVFSRLMVEDVIALAPSRVALAGACKALRAESKFMPSIKEVLDAVEAQKSACASRAALLERLPRRIAELDRANNSGADRE